MCKYLTVMQGPEISGVEFLSVCSKKLVCSLGVVLFLVLGQRHSSLLQVQYANNSRMFFGPISELWVSTALGQHCSGLALLWVNVLLLQHCSGLALLLVSTALSQHYSGSMSYYVLWTLFLSWSHIQLRVASPPLMEL